MQITQVIGTPEVPRSLICLHTQAASKLPETQVKVGFSDQGEPAVQSLCFHREAAFSSGNVAGTEGTRNRGGGGTASPSLN